MKKYNVTVNGVTYEVLVEEVSAAGAVAPAPAAAPVAAPVAAPAAAPAPAGAGEAVKAPMPGTIMKINVSVGDKVKKGDIICILEAMKMENEIFAPVDGTVTSLPVSKGASVQTDEVLATIA